MESNFFSQIVSFLTFVIFILIHLPASLCVVNEQYERCGRVDTCGNITIAYPFFTWKRATRPNYCGIGDGDYSFLLHCRDDQILSTYMEPYRILAINYSTNTLTVTRNDFGNSFCPTAYLNATIFGYPNDENMIYMYYGCHSNIRDHANRQFTCVGNRINATLGYYFTRYDLDSMAMGACNVSVLIPASESALQTLYDSPSQENLMAAIHGGFNLSWNVNNRLCSDCVESGGRCGSNVTSNEFSCYCPDWPYRYICGSSSTTNITGSSSGLNIRQKFAIGQGGYGCVYKGKLPNGRLVAVKVLNESKGNGEEFLNEVASISRTSHVNVVTLLGFCYERTKRALIYEFMPNGSLDQFIYIEKSSITNSQLEWTTLYQIAVGIARGLEYLHIGCNTRILHFDIKPHNILLNDKFCPKISDFGLAKLCERNDSIISMQGARGTAGYIAPEVFSRHFGGVSYKSDVYSYGMMVLEIVGGRRNIEVGVSHISEIYFPHWIFKYLEPASTELRLNRVITEEEEEELARKMILVGLWCIQTKPSDRPSMTKVVEMLEGSIQSIQIPPKPFLSSPPRSLPQDSSSVSVSEPSPNIS